MFNESPLSLALLNENFGIFGKYKIIFFPPDLYVGVAAGRHFAARHSGPGSYRRGQDERKSDFIEPRKKEEKVTMVTVTTVPSLTDQNTTFFKVFKELLFQHQSVKLIHFERNVLT